MSTKNWRSMNEAELTELFRKLGAAEPEAWAHSQINGILQLPGIYSCAKHGGAS